MVEEGSNSEAAGGPSNKYEDNLHNVDESEFSSTFSYQFKSNFTTDRSYSSLYDKVSSSDFH